MHKMKRENTGKSILVWEAHFRGGVLPHLSYATGVLGDERQEGQKLQEM
jgi:hypothetical protein